MENPKLEWMITRGTTILGDLHMRIILCSFSGERNQELMIKLKIMTYKDPRSHAIYTHTHIYIYVHVLVTCASSACGFCHSGCQEFAEGFPAEGPFRFQPGETIHARVLDVNPHARRGGVASHSSLLIGTGV